VEQHCQLPMPEPGSRVQRAKSHCPQHNTYLRDTVANAIIPIGTRDPVPHCAGGQPCDQAGPVLGDDGEQRPNPG